MKTKIQIISGNGNVFQEAFGRGALAEMGVQATEEMAEQQRLEEAQRRANVVNIKAYAGGSNPGKPGFCSFLAVLIGWSVPVRS